MKIYFIISFKVATATDGVNTHDIAKTWHKCRRTTSYRGNWQLARYGCHSCSVIDEYRKRNCDNRNQQTHKMIVSQTRLAKLCHKYSVLSVPALGVFLVVFLSVCKFVALCRSELTMKEGV